MFLYLLYIHYHVDNLKLKIFEFFFLPGSFSPIRRYENVKALIELLKKLRFLLEFLLSVQANLEQELLNPYNYYDKTVLTSQKGKIQLLRWLHSMTKKGLVT